jgi:hypothetical protein
MTTGTQILNLALPLMDETDTAEYSTRALSIINMLCGELYRFSDTYTVATPGTRPVLVPTTSLSSAVGVDDHLAQVVIPYGLAAQLLLGSDDLKANFLQQRYEELRRASVIPVESESITDIYGGLGLYEE